MTMEEGGGGLGIPRVPKYKIICIERSLQEARKINSVSQRNFYARAYTLAARGLEELRVYLLLKENSYVCYIILH